jgi:hypothetical protein
MHVWPSGSEGKQAPLHDQPSLGNEALRPSDSPEGKLSLNKLPLDTGEEFPERGLAHPESDP